MSVELSGEITAIATAVLTVFAIVTAWYARKAFLKQSQEVAVLLEQNKSETTERRRAQAARIFIDAPRDKDLRGRAFVKNASDFPILDAQFWYAAAGGLRDPDNLGMIMPGDVVHGGQAMSPDDVLKNAYSHSATPKASAGSGCPMAPSRSKPVTRHAKASSLPSAWCYPGHKASRDSTIPPAREQAPSDHDYMTCTMAGES